MGALYLFFTNMIFILFATWIGIKILGYKKVVYNDTKRTKRVQTIVYCIVGATVAVSAYLTMIMIQTNIFINKATNFVENEMVFPNTQVLNHSEYIRNGKRFINVTLIGASLPKDSLQLAMMNKLDSVGLGGTVINIKQGFSMSPKEMPDERNFDQFYKLMQSEIAARQTTIDSLTQLIAMHKFFSDESVRIAPEVKVIFPSVKDIALSQMVASNIDGAHTDTVDMVFVNAPSGLNVEQRERLRNYVEVRLNRNNIHVTVNPSNFPWPSISHTDTTDKN